MTYFINYFKLHLNSEFFCFLVLQLPLRITQRFYNTTASLIDIYSTLREPYNLPGNNKLDGVSLVPSLKKPSAAKELNVFFPHAERERYVVVNMKWRFIHYEDEFEREMEKNK